MPRGDGTGPMWMGMRTGRGAGYCAGFGMPGFMNPAVGFGRGRFGCGKGSFLGGGGRGRRFMFYETGMPGWMRRANADQAATPYPSQAPSGWNEKAYLENYAKWMNEELEQVKKRIEELEKEAK